MTIFITGSAVLIALTIHYLWFLARVNRGLGSLNRPQTTAPDRFVSVIVAARNEEKTIRACVDSILEQDYPKDRYEIIVVDDGSSDGTAAIVSALMDAMPSVKLITMNGEPGGNKPRAVSAGIEASSGDMILLTDADCIAGPGWIRSMASRLSAEFVFVAGPVVEAPSANLLQQLSRLEFLGLIGVSAGLIAMRSPIFCNGANIAYTKSAFRQIGGYGDADHFSDDEALMQRMHVRIPGSVTFCPDPEALITTAAASSLADLWRQRIRWSSKRGVYEDQRILAKLIALYFFFVGVLAAATGALFFQEILPVLLPVLGMKIIAEWFTLRRSARLFRQSFSIVHLFIAELVHVPYIVLTAFQGQIGSLRWKGASVRS